MTKVVKLFGVTHGIEKTVKDQSFVRTQFTIDERDFIYLWVGRISFE